MTVAPLASARRWDADRDPGHVSPPESGLTQVIKALLYIGAFIVLFWNLVTPVGIASSGVMVVVASLLARAADRSGFRVVSAVVLAIGSAALFMFLGGVIRDTTWMASALGVNGTIYASDIATFGLGLGAIVFLFRFLAKKWRVFGALEVVVIAFAVIYYFLDLRDNNISHPRWFADWALSNGLDPIALVKGGAIAIAVFSLLMVLRGSGWVKTTLSVIVALIAAGIAYKILEDITPLLGKAAATDDLLGDGDKKGGNPLDGNKDSDGDGKPDHEDEDDDNDGKPDSEDDDDDGDGTPDKDDPDGEGGKNTGGGGSNSAMRNPPPPNESRVALVTFHDDFESDEGVLYFRQTVLSTYSGTQLIGDTSGKWDADVISKFPVAGPVTGEVGQAADSHKLVPTSMFLMVDHPQPVALSHASKLMPLQNPNPNLFVAAYEVESQQLTLDIERLLGRKSVPDSWTDEQKQHYLTYPDDPRYLALSDEIVRDLDPRFQDDDLMKAYVIKRWLEKNGFYTLKQTYTSAEDPAAAFLFGPLRGYCVHFAHSAVHLFRSQGIAARVAVGYAADVQKRGSGSSMLIYGNQAHAWPEIHLDGIGWITFDVYPEQSDQPPTQVVDQDLANMLGEIARNDKTGGRAADPATRFPWEVFPLTLLGIVGLALLVTYGIKTVRRLTPVIASSPALPRFAVAGTLDRLSDIGERRHFGETLESFARRMAPLAPSFEPLTARLLSFALGRRSEKDTASVRALYRQTARELRKSIPWYKRLGGALNPIGWLLSRQ